MIFSTSGFFVRRTWLILWFMSWELSHYGLAIPRYVSTLNIGPHCTLILRCVPLAAFLKGRVSPDIRFHGRFHQLNLYFLYNRLWFNKKCSSYGKLLWKPLSILPIFLKNTRATTKDFEKLLVSIKECPKVAGNFMKKSAAPTSTYFCFLSLQKKVIME